MAAGTTLIRHSRLAAAPRLLATTARTTIVPGSFGRSVRLSCLPAGLPSTVQVSRSRSRGVAAFAVSPSRISSPATDSTLALAGNAPAMRGGSGGRTRTVQLWRIAPPGPITATATRRRPICSGPGAYVHAAPLPAGSSSTVQR